MSTEGRFLHVALAGADPEGAELFLRLSLRCGTNGVVTRSCKSDSASDSYAISFDFYVQSVRYSIKLMRIFHLHYVDDGILAEAARGVDEHRTQAAMGRVSSFLDAVRFYTSSPPGTPDSVVRSVRQTEHELSFLNSVDAVILIRGAESPLLDLVSARLSRSLAVVGRARHDVAELQCRLTPPGVPLDPTEFEDAVSAAGVVAADSSCSGWKRVITALIQLHESGQR